jgi:ABC-2 type transport system permease protein
MKLLSRSGPFLAVSTFEPVIFAGIAAAMFRAGVRPGSLLYGAIGAGMVGMWTTALIGSGQAITRQRFDGVLELLVAAPPPFVLVLAPITVASAAVGTYSLGMTLLCGRLLFGVPVHIAHVGLLAPAVAATVLGLGALGLVMASVFVLYRHANAVTNLLHYPVYLVGGMLVPATLLPAWTHPLAWLLPVTWGADAIRAAVLGGAALPALAACLGLTVCYLALGALLVRRFEMLARQRATLALA